MHIRSKKMDQSFKTVNVLVNSKNVGERNNLILSKNELQDSMALRYGLPQTILSEKTIGCGEDFSVQHALICKK